MTSPRRITALESDPRRPGAVRVLVEGRLFCTVHESAVVDAGLAVGLPWDETRREAAGLAADREAAWRALLRALERRSFATGEIRRRLSQKGHPPDAVDHAIGRALAARLLDDPAFVRQFVSSRAARGRGPARLRRDLWALGVEPSIVDQALREQWPEPEQLEQQARALAERRARQLGAIPRETKRRRLLAYLARRGFGGPWIRALVRGILTER